MKREWIVFLLLLTACQWPKLPITKNRFVNFELKFIVPQQSLMNLKEVTQGYKIRLVVLQDKVQIGSMDLVDCAVNACRSLDLNTIYLPKITGGKQAKKPEVSEFLESNNFVNKPNYYYFQRLVERKSKSKLEWRLLILGVNDRKANRFTGATSQETNLEAASNNLLSCLYFYEPRTLAISGGEDVQDSTCIVKIGDRTWEVK
jgi:hypothetical protein